MRISSSPPAKFSSPFVPTYSLSSPRRRRSVVSIFISASSSYKAPFCGKFRFSRPGLRVIASIAERRGREASWLSPELSSYDGYGGWAVSGPPSSDHVKRKGLPVFVIGGVGVSLVFIVSAVAYFTLSKKGFKFGISSPVDGAVNIVDSRRNGSITTDYGESDGDPVATKSISKLESKDAIENVHSGAFTGNVERVVIPASLDSTQLKALSILKELKIMEDEVNGGELCTRREYCRWLVRINSLLERDSRRRIIPLTTHSGLAKPAFDDVPVDDPDFGSIQALAEAGVVSSKLSRSFSSDGDDYFFPDRFVSRLDLIEWKAQLDYDISPGMTDQMMTTKVGFMDMKGMKLDSSPGFMKDMLAGDEGIFRKVFGKSKRFQPNKPSTKAQAAVALTSGRMSEAITNELLRIEVENSARQAEMEEIWSELVERGDIIRLWDEKIDTEKARAREVEKLYLDAISDLEKEKIDQEKNFASNLKEKVAMDCQRQLLLSLKEEVNVMSEKLASERTLYVAEHFNLREMLSDLESKQEGILDTKSILEAEIEALRILRSWVEDEARKSQARTKVLEEAGRRWKWNDQS